MPTARSSILAALAVSPLVIILAGCAEALPPATSAATAPPTSAADEAIVTFVRPVSTCDTGEYAVVVDGHGHFIANVASGTHVSVPLRPGMRTLYAWSNVDFHIDKEPAFSPVSALRFPILEGQENFVALEVYAPCMTRSTFTMRPAPGAGGQAELQSMIADTQLVAVDRAAGQVALEAKPVHLQQHLEQGAISLRKSQYNADQRARFADIQKEDSNAN
jgi:hypothetical protein